MNNDPRYAPVGATLPATLPPITKVEALRAYRRLVRAFGGLAHMPVTVAEGRGRPIISKRGAARTCWASTKPTTGHSKGWGRLIHDASHYVFRIRHPHARPHDGGHATLEREMAEYVAARPEWLGGLLKPIERKAPKPDAAARLARVDAAIVRWQVKEHRAINALRKLKRKRARLDRAVSTCDNPNT